MGWQIGFDLAGVEILNIRSANFSFYIFGTIPLYITVCHCI